MTDTKYSTTSGSNEVVVVYITLGIIVVLLAFLESAKLNPENTP